MYLEALKRSIDQAEVMITRSALQAQNSTDPLVVGLVGTMQSIGEALTKAREHFVWMQENWDQTNSEFHRYQMAHHEYHKSRDNRIWKWFSRNLKRLWRGR